MSIVIQFPAATDRAVRRFERALVAHDIEAIMLLAVSSPVREVQERASRWLREVLNVRGSI